MSAGTACSRELPEGAERVGERAISARRLAAPLLALLSVGAAAAPLAAQRVEAVQIAPLRANIRVGQRQPFRALAVGGDGKAIAGASFEWTTSGNGVATVTPDGIAIGVSPGVTTITVTATSGGSRKSARAKITVIGIVPAPPMPPRMPDSVLPPFPPGAGEGTLIVAAPPPCHDPG